MGKPPSHMSPSQRAKMDAAKLKAREERRLAMAGGVGPGSYHPQKPGGTGLNLSGSSAFRSSTPRISSNHTFGADTIHDAFIVTWLNAVER